VILRDSEQLASEWRFGWPVDYGLSRSLDVQFIGICDKKVSRRDIYRAVFLGEQIPVFL